MDKQHTINSRSMYSHAATVDCINIIINNYMHIDRLYCCTHHPAGIHSCLILYYKVTNILN